MGHKSCQKTSYLLDGAGPGDVRLEGLRRAQESVHSRHKMAARRHRQELPVSVLEEASKGVVVCHLLNVLHRQLITNTPFAEGVRMQEQTV